MAAPLRQAPRRLAGKPAQRIGRRELRKAALDQGFGARSCETGLIGLIRQQRLVVSARFLLQPNRLLVLTVIDALDSLASAKVQIEQPVERCATLRWRGQCCKGRLPNVFQAAGTEQLDRGQERGRLFRCDGKPVRSQQADERDENTRSARQFGFGAHAEASASRESRRGEMKCRSSSSFRATPIERLKASGHRAPPLCSNVAASAQPTSSAIPGALLSGSRRSFSTAATTARAVPSATLEARIITMRASRSAEG